MYESNGEVKRSTKKKTTKRISLIYARLFTATEEFKKRFL